MVGNSAALRRNSRRTPKRPWDSLNRGYATDKVYRNRLRCGRHVSYCCSHHGRVFKKGRKRLCDTIPSFPPITTIQYNILCTMSRRMPQLQSGEGSSSLYRRTTRQHEEPQIIYSTPNYNVIQVTRPAIPTRAQSPPQPAPAHPVRHDATLCATSATIASSSSSSGASHTVRHEKGHPVRPDGFVFNPFSSKLTNVNSLNSSRSSLLTPSPPSGEHWTTNTMVAMYAGLSQGSNSAIWAIDHEETKAMQDTVRVRDELARAASLLSEVSARDLKGLKRRVISEFTNFLNGRDGHLSLSEHHQRIEDAVARSATYGTARTRVSELSLARLDREYSLTNPNTIEHIMQFILACFGPGHDKEWKTKEFLSCGKQIIVLIRKTWFTTVSTHPLLSAAH